MQRAFVARMKRSEIRGKSPWVEIRGKSPWVAIRHKHRRRFSQRPPRIPGLRPSSGLRTPKPAFVARMKRSAIRGKSPWVAPRRKSPWAAIRHKHRRRFSQRPPRIPGLRPSSGLRTPKPAFVARMKSGKKHRHQFSQRPPRIPGLRPSSGLPHQPGPRIARVSVVS